MEGGGACNNEISDGMQCMNHLHRNNNNNPGGICALCLQDKLRNLLSSSSSSSSSPSFTPPPPTSSSSSVKTDHDHDHYTRSRLPFLVPKKNIILNNKKPSSTSTNIIFKRSKSTATPRRNNKQFLEEEDFSPRKRNGFWSFLYPSSSNGKHRDKSLGKKSGHVIVMEEDTCFSSSSKVSRSRSIGCGSRSFSGDFFERISSGLGDCTLRRVESQREGGKPKVTANTMNHCMKERVRCRGIFGGFVMTSSSSTTSSSSSSSLVSSSVDDGRGRSWGWAFASPMRAFTTKGSSKRDASDKNNATPNLSAIPSLLTVRG